VTISATAGLATNGIDSAAAQPTGEPDYGSWFDNTSNYDGTVDKTGQETVTITVGAKGNNGNFGFGPAAVRVDPGTKIVWEWSGNGSVHNVVDEAGAFESELTETAGYTFEYTVEKEGIIKYVCEPHEPMGMKGAIVVGTPAGSSKETNSGARPTGEPDYDGWFSNVRNYERTVDRSGQSEVAIAVGAGGSNGAFAFDPPAVRIDPGTTVIWEWTGNGGSHNVAATDGSFESTLTAEEGFKFEQTFEDRGIHRYVCVPHEQMGMKGALVVGGTNASDSATTGEPTGVDLGDVFAIGSGLGLVGVLLGMFAYGTRTSTREHETDS
jgi:halocyanin-like protein